MLMNTVKRFPVPKSLTAEEQDKLRLILSNYEWLLSVVNPETNLEQTFIKAEKEKIQLLRSTWARRIGAL